MHGDWIKLWVDAMKQSHGLDGFATADDQEYTRIEKSLIGF
jgi:hypothetical protein